MLAHFSEREEAASKIVVWWVGKTQVKDKDSEPSGIRFKILHVSYQEVKSFGMNVQTLPSIPG